MSNWTTGTAGGTQPKAQNYGDDAKLVTFINGTLISTDGEGKEEKAAQCIIPGSQGLQQYD